MEMLEFTAEVLIRGGRPAPVAANDVPRDEARTFDAHVDDLLFCASAAGLLATPLLSAAASYF